MDTDRGRNELNIKEIQRERERDRKRCKDDHLFGKGLISDSKTPFVS